MSSAVTEVPTPADPVAPARVLEVLSVSQAMRRGIALTDPTRNAWVFQPPDRRARACALGAALVGLFGLDESLPYHSTMLRETWPELDVFKVLCPVPWMRAGWWNARGDSLADQVINLNDRREATREQLADWLESLGF